MEIDITEFFNTAAPRDYSASMAELGCNAGRITWDHAIEDAPAYNMLDTEDKLSEFKAWIKGFGAWEDAEIKKWDAVYCNALFLQFISGDMREAGLDVPVPDWGRYENEAEAGIVPSRIFKGTDGKIYFYIGD
jgi:hypothetical protein